MATLLVCDIPDSASILFHGNALLRAFYIEGNVRIAGMCRLSHIVREARFQVELTESLSEVYMWYIAIQKE
jgi:hypothetical protein